MSRRRPNFQALEEDSAGDPAWLCTFNDLMTLLMVFFVLLFAMSSVKTPMIKNFQKSLQSGLGVLEQGGEAGVAVNQELRPDMAEDPTATDPEAQARQEAEAVAARLARRLHDLLGAESIERTAEGHLRLKDSILFSFGRADLNPSGYPVLEQIAAELRDSRVRVRIEGHTDNVPVRGGPYESNWDLSTGRAVNVLRFLVEQGGLAPARFAAVGYGDAKPCAPNRSEEGRARNRRVEIVLLKGKPQ